MTVRRKMAWPIGPREAYLANKEETRVPSILRSPAESKQASRDTRDGNQGGVSAVTVEAFMNTVG